MASHLPLFKKEGIYYFLFSNKTSWEKNDNYYFTAPAVGGPWKKGGLFVPEGKLTYNSQTTFVFPLTHGKIQFQCLWEIAGPFLIRLQLPLMYGCLCKRIRENFPYRNIGRHGI